MVGHNGRIDGADTDRQQQRQQRSCGVSRHSGAVAQQTWKQPQSSIACFFRLQVQQKFAGPILLSRPGHNAGKLQLATPDAQTRALAGSQNCGNRPRWAAQWAIGAPGFPFWRAVPLPRLAWCDFGASRAPSADGSNRGVPLASGARNGHSPRASKGLISSLSGYNPAPYRTVQHRRASVGTANTTRKRQFWPSPPSSSSIYLGPTGPPNSGRADAWAAATTLNLPLSDPATQQPSSPVPSTAATTAGSRTSNHPPAPRVVLLVLPLPASCIYPSLQSRRHFSVLHARASHAFQPLSISAASLRRRRPAGAVAVAVIVAVAAAVLVAALPSSSSSPPPASSPAAAPTP
ncbi:hypothetical protein Purlil1_9018 [Purpureocillium lilacinum]|uniref:Uncharacterized protein n=1 Tax=Purpureocillium lilacinum TaxID=33203 RepID=A0ABR0BT58_PURLI|nr:hypothetical protein Purlil1_9018 [Purpureocillium lilacinum]